MVNNLEEKYQIDIMVATRDRHSELALLLQSLRSSSFKNWNLLICDESQTPVTQCYFFNALINRIKLEGHKVKLLRNNISNGVCAVRQLLNDEQQKWNTGSNLCLRLDDDVLLTEDYIFKLLQVIETGYDMSTGVIPLLSTPEVEREVKFVKPIICYHKLDKEGNIIERKDDLGFCYLTEEILPCHQFRTNVLYKSEINKKISYPKTLTQTGFREELWFSFKVIIEGYTLGVNTMAKAFHLQTPSGGTRYAPQLYAQNVALDEDTTNKWVKEQFLKHGDFLQRYSEKVVK
ncbi:MAG: hypothetical protein AABY22_30905 [Nanoarchaeota archaeon]